MSKEIRMHLLMIWSMIVEYHYGVSVWSLATRIS